MTEPRGRGPGVVIPPPSFFVAGFVVGAILEWTVLPLWPDMGPGSMDVLRGVGAVLGLFGLVVLLSGLATFHRAKTAIYPNRDASRLVMTGPYKRTRNPMYSGLTLMYIGLCLIVGVAWALVLLPVVLLAVYTFVISREERYLMTAFGDEYRDYQRRVGRWL
jgi:protein-S-isoprenylcysteine O-methyltransferase Ste14